MERNKEQQSSEKESKTTEKHTLSQTQFSGKEELSAGTSEIEEGSQVERRKAYVEPITRQVLRNLLESGKEGNIVPSYHLTSGFTYDTKVPPKRNGPDRISRAFLENLAQLDLLQKSFYDSISTCPNCGALAITLHPSCPKCKSHHIEKTSLTEHIPCGYIDQREKYTTDICPKCGKRLFEGQYRNMGRWYICEDCGERFEHPNFNLICRECNTSFGTEEAKVLEVPKFTLNPKRRKEIRQNVASLENIGTLLTELGFRIEMPGSITGHKSGIEYHFSILAKKQIEGNELMVSVDHEVAEDEIQAQPVIIYVYKISEMEVDIPIFIALPKLSEAARKIAEGHNILIIEGSPEGQEKIAQIKGEIESRIDQINAVLMKIKKNSETETRREIAPHVLESPDVNIDIKHNGTPLNRVLRKLKFGKNSKPIIKSDTEPLAFPEEPSDNISKRNIVFLLDGSSSMGDGNGEISNFMVASKAIENVFTNPNPAAKEDMLSVIIFWDEIIRGFQKEIVYKDLSMSTYINPQKLKQFGKPKKNAGTPLWTAVESAIEFLQNKKGRKIVKLITDADSIPPLMDDTIISKLEKSSIELDCIIVGSKGNSELGKVVSGYDRGRFFESSNVASLTLALEA